MHKLATALFISFFLCWNGLSESYAQSEEDAGDPIFQTWADIALTHFFNKKWRFSPDQGVRTLFVRRNFTTLYSRPTFIYRVNQPIDLRAGLAIFYTFENARSNLTEFRLHQEFNGKWPRIAGFVVNHMIRFEQRFFFRNGEDNSESYRVRYRPSLETPDFKLFKMQRPFYILANIDLFFPLADNTERLFSNNIRLLAGLGNRHSDSFRYEIHYFYQVSRENVEGSVSTSEHIVRLRFFLNLNERK